ENPAVAVGRLRGGTALFVNLAPGPDESFTLLLAPVTVVDAEGVDRFTESVRGWFRPELPVADFLAEYSRHGGTHHAALAYGAETGLLWRFAEMMGWDVVCLG
ncbi:MAG: hypothetical protein QHJ73_08905, partial [Armatimonadota bacterium]|nr:hypothetical protein [Armatimonadota bacterium]